MTKKYVGQNISKVDAKAKVTGKADYPQDLKFDNYLNVKIKRAPYPHAILKSIDLKQAKKVDGVVDIITGQDYPDLNKFGLIIKDQPVLIGIGEKMRFLGDALAIVIAESEEAAFKARDKISLEIEKLKVISDPFNAIKKDAPAIHDDIELCTDYISQDIGKQNILVDHYLKKGDINKGFKEADLIVENTYQTQHIDQLPLQNEAGYAVYDQYTEILKIWAASQWLHDTQADVAQALNLNKDKVRIIQTAIGGAFGKKEDISVHLHLALAAMHTKRPVKLVYTREESMISQSKRHPLTIKAKTGVTEDGYLTAWQVEVFGDTGAYASSGPAVVHKGMYHCTGPYNVANVKGVSYAIYTNNTYGGAMRGFGTTQMAFAYESQIDIIADKLGMDPAQFRYQNAYDTNSTTPNGQRLSKSVNTKRTIEEAVKLSNWKGESEK
ncbi:MAG: molybdopterin-dependent oxidoreductase [Halanaerobiales bacterium]|nr:molybdopterin-dependent oxidoreductase [Halanaerobiales bacterium]